MPCEALPDLDLHAWAEPSVLRHQVFHAIPANPVPFWNDFGPRYFKNAFTHISTY